MVKLIDNNHTGIKKHSIDLRLHINNAKPISPEESIEHLAMLGDDLHKVSRLTYDSLPAMGGQNNEFQRYLHRLADTMEALALKREVEVKTTDLRFPCIIDPSDSGFPFISKEIHLLREEKVKAENNIGKFEEDSVFVESALYSLFRNNFPTKIVNRKLEKEYLEKLISLDVPRSIEFQDIVHIKEKNEMDYFKQDFSRLDDHNNLPRFYTLYFKTPSNAWSKTWTEEIGGAIKQGLSTVADLELPNLANTLECVNGVQLQMIERYDIGPFYNRFTDNVGAIEELLSHGDEGDSIITLQKFTVQRIGESKVKGSKGWIKRALSGDHYKGQFSPMIASPLYTIMPHRLIQTAHHYNITLAPNVKMFGITTGGNLK